MYAFPGTSRNHMNEPGRWPCENHPEPTPCVVWPETPLVIAKNYPLNRCAIYFLRVHPSSNLAITTPVASSKSSLDYLCSHFCSLKKHKCLKQPPIQRSRIWILGFACSMLGKAKKVKKKHHKHIQDLGQKRYGVITFRKKHNHETLVFPTKKNIHFQKGPLF